MLGKEGKATPLAKFAQATAVNVNGVFNVMSKCAEQMVRNEPEAGEERGVVINISSGAAYEAQIGQVAYAASKAALLGMNMPAARELGDVGIRVNAIAPGLFLTPMVQTLDENIVAALKSQGKEKESPLDEPFEVGVFTAQPGKKGFTKESVLAFERRPFKSGVTKVTLVVDMEPSWVGVDPYNKRIDRDSDDNLTQAKAAS